MTHHETLLRRQRAHDLRAEGLSAAAIQRHLTKDAFVGLTTVKRWLHQPRPTAADLAAALTKDAQPRPDVTGQVPLKMRFPPDLYAAMKAEAEVQGGVALNKLIGCALKLYLDCAERARDGGAYPVNLMGFRP
jgi:hypothetical protein